MVMTKTYIHVTEIDQKPFEGCSIQGPFITVRMLHASLYSRFGSNFGVSKKHLHMTILGSRIHLEPNWGSVSINKCWQKEERK